MIQRYFSFFLFCISCISFCSAQEQDEPPSFSLQGLAGQLKGLSGSEEKFFEILVEGNNRFGFDFYHTVNNNPGNLCFSPYCVASGLAMVAVGAKGESANRLQQSLHYTLSLLPLIGNLYDHLSADSKSGSQVLLANALWVQKDLPLLIPYKLAVQHEISGKLEYLDFAKEVHKAVSSINKWVSRETKGKINNLVTSQDVTPQTKLILTTALCLKGRWAHPFDPKQTKRLPFKLDAQKSWNVSLMQATSDYFVMKGEKWDLIVLPYQQGDQGAQLAMAIILPKGISIKELEKNFTLENWKQWLTQAQKETVAISLPVFHFEGRFDLNNPLKQLNLAELFTNKADFSGMTAEKGVFLNKAVHKTLVRVDESGTDGGVAAFSTQVSSKGPEGKVPYEFKADHPFLFVIWDQKTASILMMGRMSLP